MARCIIICPLYEGERLDELRPREGDLLLCADAGYRQAMRYGLRPDLTIGDFDTMPVSQTEGAAVEVLPVHKDDTDLGVCLRTGLERGYRSFLLAGCLGGRLDHTVACLQLMADYAARGCEVEALDAMNAVRVLAPGRYRLSRREGCLLSLLAFSDAVRGIDLRGTEWELEDAELTSRYPLGISNVILGEAAELSFQEGLLLVCYAVNRTWHEGA